jgi:hypothetical protein
VRRLIVLLLIAALAGLAVPSAAGAASFDAHLKAPGHHPKAGKKWPIKVTVRGKRGNPIRAKAFYQYLFNGQIVATRYPSPHHPTTDHPLKFKGSYRDPIIWPKASIGYKLTFRVVVKAKGRGTVKLNYKVRVRR